MRPEVGRKNDLVAGMARTGCITWRRAREARKHFLRTIAVSCHPTVLRTQRIRRALRAEPLSDEGETLLTMRCLGTAAVIDNRAFAADMRPHAIHVNAAAPRLPAARCAQSPPATPGMSTVAIPSLANVSP